MKNFIQPGDTLTVTAPAGGVSSGDAVEIGKLFGVAAFDAAVGDPVEVTVAGVFELPKVSTDVIAVGDLLYWDAGQAALSNSQSTTGELQVGYATKAAGNGVLLVDIRLAPGAG